MVGVRVETVRKLGQLAADGDVHGVREIVEADVDWLDAQDYRGATALIRAVESNRVEVVRYLVGKGADCTLATTDRWTPLHHCVSKDRGFAECLRLLLGAHAGRRRKRARVDAGNSDGNSCLNLCAMNNFEACAELLLEAGANPNRVNNADWSPIMQACSKGRGYASMIELLVRRGADVNLAKGDGDTALGLCCLYGFFDCAQALLRAGARVNTQKTNLWSPLMHCCGKGRGFTNIAEALAEHGADIELLNDDGNSALAICCMNGFAGIALLLLDRGARVDRQSKGGWGMLHQTVCKGRGTPQHARIALRLLEQGIDIDLRNHEHNTALNLAAMNNHAEIAQALVARGADADNQASDGWSPLHCTVGSGRGYFGIARLLVEAGCALNVRNKQGATPLGLCAMNNFKPIAGFLVRSGAGLDSQSESGWTALMEAVASGRGHKGIAKLLIAAGADLDLQNADGFSALHLAALHNFHKIVTLLLAKSCKVDLRDNDGWTPLHCVCSGDRGYAQIARQLLDAGCDVNAVDNDGWNCVFFCVHWESPPELLELVAARGADLDRPNRAGLTPLLMACQHARTDKVRQLVELGASLRAPRSKYDLRAACPQGHALLETRPADKACSLCGAHAAAMRSCRACDFELCPDCAAARRPVMAFPSPLQVARARGATHLAEYLQTICPADDDEHAAMQHPLGPPEPPASAATAAQAAQQAARQAATGITGTSKKPKQQTRRYSAVAAVKVLAKAGFTGLPAKDKAQAQAQAQATGASALPGPAAAGARASAARSQQKNESAATPAAQPEREITSRDNPRSCLTFFQERIAAVTPRRAPRQTRRGLAHLADSS
jgi:ankyrin repeat protein